MAGNIIPAIATTNAIVAGLCVLQARHVLNGALNKAHMVFISKRPDQAFITEPLRPPNPYCQVCGIIRAPLVVSPSTTLEMVPSTTPPFSFLGFCCITSSLRWGVVLTITDRRGTSPHPFVRRRNLPLRRGRKTPLRHRLRRPPPPSLPRNWSPSGANAHSRRRRRGL